MNPRSRLISGNHKLYQDTLNYIAQFYDTDAALLFNSGMPINCVRLFWECPTRDLILYDELYTYSIRAIKLSNAKPIKFTHNDFTGWYFKTPSLWKRFMW
jgi:8-amino-7-oxononanoate synthase